MSTRLMLSGHDFLMAVAQVDNLDPSQTTTLTVCIDSAKTVLVPAELYSPEMNEGYMAVNDKPLNNDERVVTATANGIVALMAVDQRIARLLSEREGTTVSYTSPLLEGVVSYAKAVRIVLTEANSYVVVSDHGKLMYAEVFATTEPDNLTFVMSKLREVMSLKGCEVRVSGQNAEQVTSLLSEMWADCKTMDII